MKKSILCSPWSTIRGINPKIWTSSKTLMKVNFIKIISQPILKFLGASICSNHFSNHRQINIENRFGLKVITTKHRGSNQPKTT